MAEATDHPAAPPAADEAPKAYSSVSLLAIGGFAVAAIYSVVVVVGAVIALFNHMPWLLPSWSPIFPLAAGAVCLAARLRIRNSEGALTGVRLTTWGVGLSLGVGLVYSAYYAGCYWALASQAQTFADGWLDLLKKDKLEQAFVMNLPPPNRPPADDPKLRDRLEIEFDRGDMGDGQFTQFRQSPIVRQFEQSGGDAQTQFLGVQKWSYDKSAYEVQLAYRISARGAISDVTFTAVGVDGVDESGLRQWYIKDTQTTGPAVLTDEGRRMSAWGLTARAFAQKWLNEVAGWDWEDAYLDTLPPAERAVQDKDRGDAFKEGLAAFRAGGIVRAEPGTFWAPAKEKDAKIALVRGLFGHGGENPENTAMGPAMPVYQNDGGQVRFGYDMVIRLPSVGTLVLGQVMVAADARDHEPRAADWRIEALELISAKSMSTNPLHVPTPPMAMPKR